MSVNLARLLAACAADRTADAARGLQIAEQLFAEDGTAENAATVAFVHASRSDWTEAVRWQRRAQGLEPGGLSQGAGATLQAQLRDYEGRRFTVEW